MHRSDVIWLLGSRVVKSSGSLPLHEIFVHMAAFIRYLSGLCEEERVEEEKEYSVEVSCMAM